jgi:hypothetical protein
MQWAKERLPQRWRIALQPIISISIIAITAQNIFGNLSQ